MVIMFPYLWRDGTWRECPEPRPEQEAKAPPVKKPWVKRGFFKGGLEAPAEAAHTRNNATHFYRVWLERTLRKPMLAREVLQLAKRAGLSEWGLRRAKKRLGIKAIRLGGIGTGRQNPWLWKPTNVSE